MTLREICELSERFQQLNLHELEMYKKEIGLIELNEMENYFLSIIHDKHLYVDNECNSMIAWLCEITDNKPLNSVAYKSGSNPDIDMDFEDSKREDVIKYMTSKYGDQNIAGIGTYGVMWAKAAIRFAGKSLGMELEFVDSIAKLVPELQQGRNWHIDAALETSAELKEKYLSDSNAKTLIDYAAKLDGMISNRSQHPAGIILFPDPINTIAPTFRNNNDFPVVEYTDGEIEDLGAVKMDFLGLRTLSIIGETLKLIRQRHGRNLTLEEIPLDDKESFHIFATGKLMGIFQLEAKDISNYTKLFKPKSLEEVAIISSGYRPGPLQFMHDILRMRNGNDWQDNQPHGDKFPLIAEILKETYGYFLFQEQIQKVVQLLAGYSDHEADEFRKIIGKKLKDKMEKEKLRFFPKAKRKGMSDKDVQELWDQMESFANYSFNKSHGIAYSMLTVKTAWLKTYYPAEFFAANIINEIHDQEKVTSLIEEAKFFKIKVLPPDINKSNTDFSIITDNILRFGLAGIKSLGVNTAIEIIKQRDEKSFDGIIDFIIRTNIKTNVFESMIKAGCFDDFCDRNALLTNKYYAELCENLKDFSEFCIIDYLKESIFQPPVHFKATDLEKSLMEKETIGLYVSINPIEIYKELYPNAKHTLGTILSAKPFKSGKGCAFTAVVDNAETTILVLKEAWNKLKSTYKECIGEPCVIVKPNIMQDKIIANGLLPVLTLLEDRHEVLYLEMKPTINHFNQIQQLQSKLITGHCDEIPRYAVVLRFIDDKGFMSAHIGYLENNTLNEKIDE